jgi:hypothetical protein
VLNEVASRIGLPAEANLNIAGGTG